MCLLLYRTESTVYSEIKQSMNNYYFTQTSMASAARQKIIGDIGAYVVHQKSAAATTNCSLRLRGRRSALVRMSFQNESTIEKRTLRFL